jgi:hypothetical protein
MPASHHAAPLVRFGRLLLAVALCATLGLHWAALQAVAWTQMLVTYSHHAALGEAVKKTFDGEHPCSLCLLVKHGQNEERKHESAPLTKKLDAVLVRVEAAPIRFAQTAEFAILGERAEGWLETPPVPPPRA